MAITLHHKHYWKIISKCILHNQNVISLLLVLMTAKPWGLKKNGGSYYDRWDWKCFPSGIMFSFWIIRVSPKYSFSQTAKYHG